MASALSIIWFVSAIGGAVLALAGLAIPEHRRTLLTAAGGAFAVAGFLGLASIGILFLLLAGLSIVAGERLAPD